MILTARDALEHFAATAAYTHSDEISLLFAAGSSMQPCHLFGGRVLKLSSVPASFCSVRFVMHLMRLIATNNDDANADANESLATFVRDNPPFFDGRAFSLQDHEQCLVRPSHPHVLPGEIARTCVLLVR